MLGLGFAANRNLLPISTTRSQHLSPDSAIFPHESKPIDRCFDHQSLISQLSKDLVRDLERTASSGPDKIGSRTSVRKSSNPIKKNMPKEEAGVDEKESDEDGKVATPPKNSLEDIRVSRPEALLRKQEQRGPASVDLSTRGHVTSSSPRFVAMKKTSAASRQTGVLPSPGTPSYCQGTGDGMGLQKASNAERVLPKANCSGRYGNAALLPSNNGRNLPSKWEDAEKWIFSPVEGGGVNRPPLIPPQYRRPLSKSGPLGGLGASNYSSPVFDGEKVGNFTGSSLFSAGVLVPDSLSGQVFGGGGGNCPVLTEHYCIMRSASVNGWSDMRNQSSLPRDKKDGTKGAATKFSLAISRRDIGTQMSPVRSPNLSPKAASGSSVLPIAELQSNHPSKLDVKDVQVDDHVTVSKRSKKIGAQGLDKCSTNDRERKKKVAEPRASDWEVAETEKCISKVKRDEASIMAWENLQKAKAEAEIRKLEMKLEKMRTSSMNKIMNKLRLAQRKAQEMRSSVSASKVHEVSMTSEKAVSFRKVRQMGSLTGCFTCHAF
eukprot:TRINITY_DN4575_c0_g1_i5.p1 TRINITY_DN4575_c0_g1~~TRINITY_DN4575_c0_g1_i5.p1  ORF type:complete len:547 (-),score=124.10 TRINITY_DN4575_c0_g1_i5:608-2248(-)